MIRGALHPYKPSGRDFQSRPDGRLSFQQRSVGLAVFDAFVVQVVLGGAVVGTADHRFPTDILGFGDQT